MKEVIQLQELGSQLVVRLAKAKLSWHHACQSRTEASGLFQPGRSGPFLLDGLVVRGVRSTTSLSGNVRGWPSFSQRGSSVLGLLCPPQHHLTSPVPFLERRAFLAFPWTRGPAGHDASCYHPPGHLLLLWAFWGAPFWRVFWLPCDDNSSAVAGCCTAQRGPKCALSLPGRPPCMQSLSEVIYR